MTPRAPAHPADWACHSQGRSWPTPVASSGTKTATAEAPASWSNCPRRRAWWLRPAPRWRAPRPDLVDRGGVPPVLALVLQGRFARRRGVDFNAQVAGLQRVPDLLRTPHRGLLGGLAAVPEHGIGRRADADRGRGQRHRVA